MHPLRRLFQHAGQYRAQVLWASTRAVRRSVLSALLWVSAARSQSFGVEPPRIAQFQLANGLDVILEEDDRQPRVAVMMAYDVGQRDDPPGLAGLSHLLEHLSFRSSRHLPGLYAGVNLLQRAGASDINGFTTPDVTVYQQVVPSDALPLALFVESERMAFSLEKISAASIRVERDIVWRETQLRAARPLGELERDNQNAFFGEDHPYFRAPESSTDLNGASLRAVQAFFQQTYRPDNAHLILVGDFELAEARALVERYFGTVVSPGLARKRAGSLPTSFVPARSFVLRNGDSVDALRITWVAPAPDTEAGMASLLFARQLRHNVGAALAKDISVNANVNTRLTSLDLATLLTVQINVETDIEPVSRLFEAELRRVWKTDWAKELVRLRRDVLLDQGLRRESLLAVAEDHLTSTRSARHPFDSRVFAEHLARVTPAQMRALSAWFSGQKAMVGWLLHVNDDPRRRTSIGLSVVPR